MVLKIRSGTEEFAEKLVEVYFLDDNDYIYILNIRCEQIKRYVIQAAKYGSIVYGVSTIAENIIWVHDRVLIQFLARDLTEVGLLRDLLGLSRGNKDEIVFGAIASITNVNVRTAAAVQICVRSVIVAGFTIGLSNLAIATIPVFITFVGSMAVAGLQYPFIRYLAPLKLVYKFLGPYLNVVFERRGDLRGIEPRFEPMFPKKELESITDALTSAEDPNADLDRVLFLSGSDKTLRKIKDSGSQTLGDLMESETHASLRQRGLERLGKARKYLKGRYGSIKDYFFPKEGNPLWVDNDKYFNLYDSTPLE